MGTRANIVMTESYLKTGKRTAKEITNKLYYYRHYDGYPDGVMPALNKLLDWLQRGKIRNNIQQAGGWLMLLGAIEYLTIPEYKVRGDGDTLYGDIDSVPDPKDWKVGAYEPTDAIHGDIDYLYELNLTGKKITVFEYHYNSDGSRYATDITARVTSPEPAPGNGNTPLT